MKYSLLCIVLCLLAGLSCRQPGVLSDPSINQIDHEQVLHTIAFGSCSKQDEPQPMWTYILQNNPDVWLWVGDNIYGDSDNPAVLESKYKQQLGRTEYQELLQTTPVFGIWDDHDYGKNDGDKTFPIKQRSKELMMDFLQVPDSHEVHQREGAYQAYICGKQDRKVKIILLDARYFRDTLSRQSSGDRAYIPNQRGDILGEAQWVWLERELSNSDAQIHLIASGIQVIPMDHVYEKWANFPSARQRLFDLLARTQPNNAIFLSGDRHFAEISRIQLNGLDGPLYDITSSGLTHSYKNVRDVGEINQHREGDKLSGEKNFGLLHIDWEADPIRIKAEIRGLDNVLIFDSQIR